MRPAPPSEFPKPSVYFQLPKVAGSWIGLAKAVGVGSLVHFSMTVGTKCYQVFPRVLAELAARFEMMDLQIFRATTGLAAPAITP